MRTYSATVIWVSEPRCHCGATLGGRESGRRHTHVTGPDVTDGPCLATADFVSLGKAALRAPVGRGHTILWNDGAHARARDD